MELEDPSLHATIQVISSLLMILSQCRGHGSLQTLVHPQDPEVALIFTVHSLLHFYHKNLNINSGAMLNYPTTGAGEEVPSLVHA